MKSYIRFIARKSLYTAVMVAFVLTSCTHDRMEGRIDDESLIFGAENIEGDEEYYSKAAVITGHIANRDVYPNTTEICITVPFYDRVDTRQTSLIYDDEFGFSILPY